jgi:hypothetical protein
MRFLDPILVHRSNSPANIRRIMSLNCYKTVAKDWEFDHEGQTRNAHRISVWEPLQKWMLGRKSRRLENNIKMYVLEIQSVPKRCIHFIIRNINLVYIHIFGTLCRS